MKKTIHYLSVICLSLSLIGCENKKPIKEVVLYTDINSISWLEYKKTYTPLESDRLDAFNKRLKALGINAKLVVKSYLPAIGFEQKGNLVQNILEQDPDADMIFFDSSYTKDLEPLDPYLKSYKGQELTDQFSNTWLHCLKINNKSYMVPKNVYPLTKQCAIISIQTFNKYPELKNQKSALEVLQYMNTNYQPMDNQVLFLYISLPNLLADQYQIITNDENSPLYLRKSDYTVVNIYEEEPVLEIMRLINTIHQKGLTGKDMDEGAYNRLTSMPDSGQALQFGNNYSFTPQEETFKTLYFGLEKYASGSGLSILKDSDAKEEAFEILCAMNTDKKAAEILQYGPEPKRDEYNIIIDNQHTYFGSWNILGNDMITESSQGQPDNKKEYFKTMEEKSDVDHSNNTPLLFDTSSFNDKLDSFLSIIDKNQYVVINNNTGIYLADHAFNDKQFEEYLNTVQTKLKKAGIDKVKTELQKQVDNWLKEQE